MVLVVCCISLLSSYLLKVLSLRHGMPKKRWMLLGAIFGPFALPLYNIHYRRALLRQIGSGKIRWLP